MSAPEKELSGFDSHRAQAPWVRESPQQTYDTYVGCDVADPQARYGISLCQGVDLYEVRYLDAFSRGHDLFLGISLIRLVYNHIAVFLQQVPYKVFRKEFPGRVAWVAHPHEVSKHVFSVHEHPAGIFIFAEGRILHVECLPGPESLCYQVNGFGCPSSCQDVLRWNSVILCDSLLQGSGIGLRIGPDAVKMLFQMLQKRANIRPWIDV